MTYGDKDYCNIRVLNMPEDDVQCEYFTVISIDSLLVYENKYYLQVYLDNFTHKIVDKQMADYLETDRLSFWKWRRLAFNTYDIIDLSEGIDVGKSNNSKDCMCLSLLVF